MVLALADPDDRTLAVVVGHDGQVPMPLAIGDLVDPDAVEVRPTRVSSMASATTSMTILATASQEIRNNLVMVVLSVRWANQATTSWKSLRVPGPGPGPGDLLGAHPPTALAVDAGDLGLEEAPGRPQIQVPPAPHRAVVGRPGLLPAWTAVLGPAPAQPDHDSLGGEGHAGHRCTDEAQHLVECSGGRGCVLPGSSGLLGRFRNYEGGACTSLREEAPATPGPIT